MGNYFRYKRGSTKLIIKLAIAWCSLLPVLWVFSYSLYLHLSRPDGRIVLYNNVSLTCGRPACITEHQQSCLVAKVTMDVLCMITPLFFNFVTYGVIMKVLYRNGYRRSTNTWIIVIRTLLTSVFYAISWIPFFVLYRVLKHPRDDFNMYNVVSICFFINTLTDPIFYLVPNKLITTCIYKYRNKISQNSVTAKRGFSLSIKSDQLLSNNNNNN